MTGVRELLATGHGVGPPALVGPYPSGVGPASPETSVPTLGGTECGGMLEPVESPQYIIMHNNDLSFFWGSAIFSYRRNILEGGTRDEIGDVSTGKIGIPNLAEKMTLSNLMSTYVNLIQSARQS